MRGPFIWQSAICRPNVILTTQGILTEWGEGDQRMDDRRLVLGRYGKILNHLARTMYIHMHPHCRAYYLKALLY